MWESDVPLAALTRYRIGGTARRYGLFGTLDDLARALRSLDRSSYRVLGWGANVLVSDRGVPDSVISLAGEFDYVVVSETRIDAGGAAGMPALVGEARRWGRSGWDFLEAVPGSVGGGLRMNAGSVDTGLWDRSEWVDTMTPEGEKVRLTPAEASPSYRHVDVADDWVFLGGHFEAQPGDPGTVNSEHARRRRLKVERQVYELPSCGSIWRNPGPPHVSAWELVDRAGMRGAERGGARITERHANFIVNVGDAHASDVLSLMAETRRRVHDNEGIWLEPEIRLWGFDAEELASVGAVQ